jgi:hypothetical protein
MSEEAWFCKHLIYFILNGEFFDIGNKITSIVSPWKGMVTPNNLPAHIALRILVGHTIFFFSLSSTEKKRSCSYALFISFFHVLKATPLLLHLISSPERTFAVCIKVKLSLQ